MAERPGGVSGVRRRPRRRDARAGHPEAGGRRTRRSSGRARETAGSGAAARPVPGALLGPRPRPRPRAPAAVRPAGPGRPRRPLRRARARRPRRRPTASAAARSPRRPDRRAWSLERARRAHDPASWRRRLELDDGGRARRRRRRAGSDHEAPAITPRRPVAAVGARARTRARPRDGAHAGRARSAGGRSRARRRCPRAVQVRGVTGGPGRRRRLRRGRRGRARAGAAGVDHRRHRHPADPLRAPTPTSCAARRRLGALRAALGGRRAADARALDPAAADQEVGGGVTARCAGSPRSTRCPGRSPRCTPPPPTARRCAPGWCCPAARRRTRPAPLMLWIHGGPLRAGTRGRGGGTRG